MGSTEPTEMPGPTEGPWLAEGPEPVAICCSLGAGNAKCLTATQQKLLPSLILEILSKTSYPHINASVPLEMACR